MKYLLIVLVLVIVFIVLYIVNNYNKIKDFNETIENSLEKIKELLLRKKEILEKVSKDLKDKELKASINQSNDEDIFQFENILFDAKWKINDYINEKKYTPEAEYIDYINELNSLEEDIEGLKNYYNSKVLNYNEKFYKKPFTIIYKLLKLESKKDFKLRKIDDYEILKN